ncbi:hypothetical protein [Verminephrobacter aporrectodeae]|uniref:hypothetical protein n=1 Tax=Verminephrobacter aporrectodeae TaxID=1110389 RepID=UPI002242F711|nr:hypothetical protein [Verminephrobacter aporrectodeae]
MDVEITRMDGFRPVCDHDARDGQIFYCRVDGLFQIDIEMAGRLVQNQYQGLSVQGALSNVV